jgi:hypothetical protein
MKRLLWAALLALPILCLSQEKAAAQCAGCCTPLGCFPIISGWWHQARECAQKYHLCRICSGTCWTANSHWPGASGLACGSCGGGCLKGCGSCGKSWGSCGGCGSGCGGCGSCFKSCFCGRLTGCCGNAPGPWYTFWPGSDGFMTSSYATPGWVYDMNFQTPAPIAPYGPVAAYPSYWVGSSW